MIDNSTSIHRFTSLSDIRFRMATITEKNFEEPDVEHRHGYWTIFIFLEGKGKHVIDFKEVTIKPGSIHFVLPGQVHALHGGKKFLAHALMFTEEFFLMRDETTKLLMRLFRFMDAGEAAAFDITKDDKDYFTALLQLLKYEHASSHANKETVLLDLLSVFISKCSTALHLPQLPADTDSSQAYIKLRNAIEKNFRHKRTVAEYAQLLHLSPKQINTLCHTHMGCTALEFIHSRIITEAKRLLKFSNKPVKQIAFDLQFTDAAHFANFFKQKTGATPLEFKEGK